MTEDLGIEIYNVDQGEVIARGVQIDDETLSAILSKQVKDIIHDSTGKEDIRQMLTGIASTGFEKEVLEQVLTSESTSIPDWRIGEALAQVYITNKHDCDFPWPAERDLKNPDASPAGADLVGFQRVDEQTQSYRFAFGEIKTSTEEKWPPHVSHSRKGLQNQINALRDTEKVKHALLRYISHHAKGATWFAMYQSAMQRYLSTKCQDATIFGILVRDVDPKEADLTKHAINSLKGKSSETRIILTALYLSKGLIPKLPDMLQKGDAI